MWKIASTLWRDRLEGLKSDLNRINALLVNDRIQLDNELAGRFTSPLSELLNAAERLGELSQTSSDLVSLWKQLAGLRLRIQTEIDAQLEILGGIGITQGMGQGLFKKSFDDGASRQAEDWLNLVSEPLHLDRVFVLIGRGPQLDVEKGIVRLPFLDWDIWHMPLLGRALGLLVCEEKKYAKKLDQVIDPVIAQVEGLLSGDPEEPPADLGRLLPEVQALWQRYLQIATTEGRAVYRENNRAYLERLVERQRQFIYFLFSDQFATAILGPAYAIPVFVFELDFRSSNLLEIENPDSIEERDFAPRILPASVHRVAAILATLEAMDREGDRPANRPGPYQDIIQRLAQIWQKMLASTHQADPLPAVRELYRPWLDALYRQVIWEMFRTRILDPVNHDDTETHWQIAQAWYESFLKPANRPSSQKPSVHILAAAMWLHRLDYPEMADDLLAVVDQWRPDQWVPMKATQASLEKVVAHARLNRLKNRWERLEKVITSEQIPDDDRAAVTGRFYRLLSEQFYGLERAQQGIQGDQIRLSVWEKTNDLYHQARPILREGLEFLGGLLVHLAGLDREPVKITQTQEGSSICDLADNILRNYARRTGVNWSARTVLGRNPFLEPSTEVIRVRFPDWSVWNLPLMAHEFGHVAALAMPAFHEFKKSEGDALKGEVRTRQYHLDEYFADIFAVYTFGPAFACDAILLQFNPAEAYLPRGIHPAHDERAQLILATLERMNEITRKGPWDEDAVYGALIRQLREAWRAGVDACQMKPEDEAAYSAQLADSMRWGRGLYRIIDTSFRLGAGYKPMRWKFAQVLADSLSGVVPEKPAIYYLAQKSNLETVTLSDVLNAFWLARAQALENPRRVEELTSLADSVCRIIAEG